MKAEPVGDVSLKGFTRPVKVFNLLEMRVPVKPRREQDRARCKGYTMTR